VLGVLTRRARPWGALVSVGVGVPVGFYMNLHDDISWPVATGTVIAVSVGTLLLSGLFPSRDPAYRQRVNVFFKRLDTPIPEGEKPSPNPRFEVAMRQVFALALATTGVLFAGLGLLSVHDRSGVLSAAAGGVCLALAAVVFFRTKRLEPVDGRG